MCKIVSLLPNPKCLSRQKFLDLYGVMTIGYIITAVVILSSESEPFNSTSTWVYALGWLAYSCTQFVPILIYNNVQNYKRIEVSSGKIMLYGKHKSISEFTVECSANIQWVRTMSAIKNSPLAPTAHLSHVELQTPHGTIIIPSSFDLPVLMDRLGCGTVKPNMYTASRVVYLALRGRLYNPFKSAH